MNQPDTGQKFSRRILYGMCRRGCFTGCSRSALRPRGTSARPMKWLSFHTFFRYLMLGLYRLSV